MDPSPGESQIEVVIEGKRADIAAAKLAASLTALGIFYSFSLHKPGSDVRAVVIGVMSGVGANLLTPEVQQLIQHAVQALGQLIGTQLTCSIKPIPLAGD
jgi:hypothetical protein